MWKSLTIDTYDRTNFAMKRYTMYKVSLLMSAWNSSLVTVGTGRK